MKSSPLPAIYLLPPVAKSAFIKLMNIIPLMVPNRESEAEIRRISDANKLTKEEGEAFRRHFPDGFFGRIVVDPDKQNDLTHSQKGRERGPDNTQD